MCGCFYLGACFGIVHADSNTSPAGARERVSYDVPFVFSSNGDGFIFRDRTTTGSATETTLALEAFPSPADIWTSYRAWKGRRQTKASV